MNDACPRCHDQGLVQECGRVFCICCGYGESEENPWGALMGLAPGVPLPSFDELRAGALGEIRSEASKRGWRTRRQGAQFRRDVVEVMSEYKGRTPNTLIRGRARRQG